MANNVGDIVAIVAGLVTVVGAIALGVTSYSLDSINDNQHSKPFKKNKETDDSEDEEKEKEEEVDIMERVTNLSDDLKDIRRMSGFNRDQYSLTPEEGWSKSGGKRSKKNKKSKKRSKKRKSVKK